MAKDKVYITLEVTDKGTAVVKGFDKNTEQAFNKMKSHAKASTASMGSSLQKLKAHWVAYSVGAVAAVVAIKVVMTRLINTLKTWTRLSMVQEDAEIGLTASLKANLEYTDELNAKYQEFAATIQKKTKYGDEEVLQLMALQKNLGVTIDKVEEATKMSIGLAAATGRDVQSMAMYVALAQQGEFTMLRRYIPALRSTTDATEQLKIITDFAARGFKVAQEVTESFSGSLKQTGNLWGDLREKIASVITKNQTILDLMKQTREWLINVGERVDAWREKNQALIDQKMKEYLDETLNLLTGISEAVKLVYRGYDKVIKLLKDNQSVFNLPLIGQIAIIKKALEKWGEYKRAVKEIQAESQTVHVKAPAGGFSTVKPELPLLEDATPKFDYDLGLINAEFRVFQLQSEAAWAAYQKGIEGTIPKQDEFLAGIYGERTAIMLLEREIEEGLAKSTADHVDVYREMYRDAGSLAKANYDLRLNLLQKQRDDYLTITGDQATVSAWYAAMEKDLILEKNQAILESTTSLTEAMSAAWENYIIQTKSDIEQLVDLSIEISQTIAQGIGDAYAQAILYGKDLGKSFQDLMKSTAATIISSLIEIGVQRMIQWVAAKILGITEATSRMATLAAETYAGAFAATVAIPIIGPAMAPGVAAASLATMLAGSAAAAASGGAAGAGVATYHTGGIVGRDSRPTRLVSPDVFVGAQRAHQGLGPDERPVIVKKDEGIFTKEQMAAMGAGDDVPGRIDFHVHVIFNGREVTKDMAHTLETDGILLDRFRRALS